MTVPAPTQAPGAKRRYCRSAEYAGRAELIVKLRESGKTFRDIGREVGCSSAAATSCYYRAVRSGPPAVSWRLEDELRASWALGYFRGPEREARARLAAAYGVAVEVVDQVLDGPRSGAPVNPERTGLLDRLRAAKPEQRPSIFDHWTAIK